MSDRGEGRNDQSAKGLSQHPIRRQIENIWLKKPDCKQMGSEQPLVMMGGQEKSRIAALDGSVQIPHPRREVLLSRVCGLMPKEFHIKYI